MTSAAAILVLMLQAPADVPPIADDAAVLRIEGGKTVRPCMDCPQQEVRFRVTVLAGAGKIVLTKGDRPEVLRVSTNGPRVYNLESAFDARWDPPIDTPRTLVLTIDPPLRAPGTYDIVLNLLPATRPLAPSETVQLVVAGASLQGPEKLLILRTVYAPFWATVRSTPLVVTETGRAVPIKDLGLKSLPFAHQNEPIDGEIVKNDSPTPVAIAAGGSGTVGYRLNDRFPLGLSSGKVLLSAPEVTTALAISVEVRNQLSRFYLALAIIAGLFLSWHVKVRLQRRLQLYQARAAAGQLLQEVEKDRSIFPDPTFQEATERPLKELKSVVDPELREKVVGQSLRERVDEARKALDTAWRAARQELEARRTAFRTQLDAWQKVVSLDWHLPRSVALLLTPAREAAVAATTLDQKGNVKAASDALEAAGAETSAHLREAGRNWQRASRRFFDELLGAQAGVSPAILEPLKNRSNAWRLTYPEIQPDPTRDPSTVHPLLRQITGEYVTARDHLRELARHVQREFDDVSAELSANGAADLLPAIGERLTLLDRRLSAAEDDPATAADELRADLDALQAAWEAAFTTATTNEPDAVRQLVKARDFRGAAARLGEGAEVLDAAAAAGMTARERFEAGLAIAPVAPGGALVRGELPPESPFAALVHATEQQIRQTKLLQTIIVGGLFFVWAMTTSSATFDGTVRGLFVALFSAFSIDVGVDTLFARIKGTAFS